MKVMVVHGTGGRDIDEGGAYPKTRGRIIS